MTPRLRATEAERIPTDATVRHYDELTGDAKHLLPAAAESDAIDVPLGVADQFTDPDYVKYVDYYRVTVSQDADAETESSDARRAFGDPLPEST